MTWACQISHADLYPTNLMGRVPAIIRLGRTLLTRQRVSRYDNSFEPISRSTPLGSCAVRPCQTNRWPWQCSPMARLNENAALTDPAVCHSQPMGDFVIPIERKAQNL
jgi:hypothetical protein